MYNTISPNRPNFRASLSYSQTTFNSTNIQSGHTNWNSQGGVVFSPQAQILMERFSLMNQLRMGDFGQLMNQLTPPNRRHQHRPPSPPSFGSTSAPGIRKGQSRELKAGGAVRGANGTLVKRGKNNVVSISYKDKHGKKRTLEVRDGMLSLDGGKPQKLSNRGQFLKLPNGDVVAIGNAEGKGGKKQLTRVAVSDRVDAIKTDEAGKSNIYDVTQMERQQIRHQGGGVSLQLNAGSYATPFGQAGFLNANITAFAGIPVLHRAIEQSLHLTGAR